MYTKEMTLLLGTKNVVWGIVLERTSLGLLDQSIGIGLGATWNSKGWEWVLLRYTDGKTSDVTLNPL